MILHGFQKLTLLDYPGHTACTLFTAGCNFRCPFCHNALLVTDITSDGAVDSSEVLQYLSKRTGVLDGVCVTGGEPLLQPELPALLRQIKGLGYAVKLDTNGSFPEKLRALVNDGLVDYVAMDVKNTMEKYAATVGLPVLDVRPIEESIDFLLSGAIPFEFRTTVIREFHEVSDIAEIARRIKGAPRYFLQNFKASDNMIDGANLHPHTPETLTDMCRAARENVPETQIRGL